MYLCISTVVDFNSQNFDPPPNEIWQIQPCEHRAKYVHQTACSMISKPYWSTVHTHCSPLGLYKSIEITAWNFSDQGRYFQGGDWILISLFRPLPTTVDAPRLDRHATQCTLTAHVVCYTSVDRNAEDEVMRDLFALANCFWSKVTKTSW